MHFVLGHTKRPTIIIIHIYKTVYIHNIAQIYT